MKASLKAAFVLIGCIFFFTVLIIVQQNPSGRVYAISNFGGPVVVNDRPVPLKFSARIEETSVKPVSRQEAEEHQPTGQLLEYYGALYGCVFSLAFLGLSQSNLITYYNLESTITLAGVVIGFLWSYSAYTRKHGIE